MFIYSCIAVFSTVYSVFPELTLWKAFEVLTLIVCGYAIATEVQTTDDIRRLLDLVMLILLFLTVTVLMGAVISPERAFRNLFEGGNPFAEDDRPTTMMFVLRGVIPEINANPVGGLAASLAVMTASPFFAPEKVKDKFGIIVVLMLAGIAIVLAHARTPIFALTATVAGILVVKRQFAASLWIALAAVIMLLIGSTEVVTDYIYRGQSQEQFSTLTGRTLFWSMVFEKFLDAPIFGYGYYSSHRVLFNTSGVDNTYITVLLGIGVVGFIPFVASVLSAIKTLLRTMPRRRMEPMFQILWIQLFGIFSITFVRSLTGTSFEVFYHLLIFYLLIQISLTCLQRQLRKIHVSGNQREVPRPRAQRVLTRAKRT
jgi:O-antigen ligase